MFLRQRFEEKKDKEDKADKAEYKKVIVNNRSFPASPSPHLPISSSPHPPPSQPKIKGAKHLVLAKIEG